MLEFASPAAFTQKVRQVARSLNGGRPLVIVEGKYDKAAVFPFLVPNVHVLCADGKEKVIAAYRDLDAHLRSGVLFLLDCDGTLTADLKGQVDLVISANRDLEADLVLDWSLTRFPGRVLCVDHAAVAAGM